MIKPTIELMMSEYFLIKAVLGKYLDDSKLLFLCLGRIFLIPEAEAEKLYALAENETAKAITSEQDFKQHSRMKQYTRLCGRQSAINAEWEEIAEVKGNAITVAHSLNLATDAGASRNAVYTCLSSAAAGGNVTAMRITGILQCEGIFLGKNERSGVKNLCKSADWNDIVSTLALLYYCPDKRAYNAARLKQVTEDSPFYGLYKTAAKSYDISGVTEVGEVKLLNKAFGAGMLKRDAYNPKYARIINSGALLLRDKERAVFSPNKDHLSVIGDLPLKLSGENISAVNAAAFSSALKRGEETEAVVRSLKNSDLRALISYRPLCLCCEDMYVLNMYAKAISKASENTHTEIIDVAQLRECDFESTPNNIFVRSVDEDKDNRFLLFFCGEIPEHKLDAAKSILQSGRRAKFHLNSPGITLDLSAVLPVCFCDGQNANKLKPYCDVVQLKAVAADEMSAAIADILSDKQRIYGVGKIQLDGVAADIFCGYGIDTAEKIIDEAVRDRRERGADITLSREDLQCYYPDYNLPLMGFGGMTYVHK